jgi:beta-mannosidase
VRTRRFAQWVAIDVPGFAPDDSWFHLAPGGERTVTLRPFVEGKPPRGRVRALNGLYSSPIVIED